MRAVGILLVVCLFALAANAAVEPRCPTVHDGLTNGVFDMSTQFSTSSLSANWFGLENSEVLGYEYAIISDSLATKAMRTPPAQCTSLSLLVISAGGLELVGAAPRAGQVGRQAATGVRRQH